MGVPVGSSRRRRQSRTAAPAVPSARPQILADAAEAARVEVVQPLGLHPDDVSPVLASMARAWSGAMNPAERVALLDPLLPRLAGSKALAEVEERRAIMAADFAVRRYLPNWLARAGLDATAQRIVRLPAPASMSDVLASRPIIEAAAAEANAAWVTARERVKAEVPPDAWGRVREDVRDSVRFLILASAEASIRIPVEDTAWAKVAHFLWEAAAACFWASAWDGVRTGTADGTIPRVAAVMLPMRNNLNRQAMALLAGMVALGPAPRPAFYDVADFPVLQAVAHHWPAMRADLDDLHAPLMDVDRVGKPHAAVVAEVGQRVQAGEAFGWVKGWGGEAGGNRDWTQFGLVIGDQPIPFAVPVAPRTLHLLSKLRGLKVAAFVRLAPGTLLPTHTHPEIEAEGLLQAHITLKAPPPSASCLLNVAGDIRQHATGCALVFDGSLPHWALNASGDERVILYLESHRVAFQRPRDTTGALT